MRVVIGSTAWMVAGPIRPLGTWPSTICTGARVGAKWEYEVRNRSSERWSS